jgi:hypothetical protein
MDFSVMIITSSLSPAGCAVQPVHYGNTYKPTFGPGTVAAKLHVINCHLQASNESHEFWEEKRMLRHGYG